MNRYIIGTLALLGLAILLLILLFSGGSKKTPPNTTKFSSYVYSDSEMKLVIDGPLAADQNHNSIVISITQHSATYNLIQGYDGHVVNSKVFNNNQNSYKNFVYGLYYAGYTQGQTSTYASDVGLCPTGDKYDYYLINDGQQVQHYWTTNCTSTPKTYLGNQSLTLYLFENQIPNIGTLSQTANISGL